MSTSETPESFQVKRTLRVYIDRWPQLNEVLKFILNQEAELTAAKAEVEKLKQINDTQARELIERGKDIDTLKTAMHQSPTKLCHIDRDRAEQQRCKRCEAYLSDKRPAGRTLCEDCMRLPEHTYIPPVIIPPAKPHDIGWPLPAPPWGNISTTPLRDQNTP